MPSIALTPRPDLGAMVVNVTTDGLTMTSLRRWDANGPGAEVRMNAGTLPTTNPPVLVDYEVALIGGVTYQARFSNGSTTAASWSAGWYDTDEAWLSVPLWPTRSVAVSMITGYDAARASGNVFHEIIDRVDPAVTLAPLRTRAGTFDVWCPDYATTLAVAAVCDLAQVLQLRQPDHPGLDMYFTTAGEVRTTHYQPQRGIPTRWSVTIPYREVARPEGNLIENAGWTFDDVTAEFATFDDVAAAFATFDDLATNTRLS